MPWCCCLRTGHEIYALSYTKSELKSWVWPSGSRPMKVGCMLWVLRRADSYGWPCWAPVACAPAKSTVTWGPSLFYTAPLSTNGLTWPGGGGGVNSGDMCHVIDWWGHGYRKRIIAIFGF